MGSAIFVRWNGYFSVSPIFKGPKRRHDTQYDDIVYNDTQHNILVLSAMMSVANKSGVAPKTIWSNDIWSTQWSAYSPVF
jgi:hypothetical protein